jgi:hypothetical protein
MDVAIASCTTRASGVGRVRHVEEDQAAAAWQVTSNPDRLVTSYRAYSHGVVELLVDYNVVGSSNRKLIPVSSEVLLGEVGRTLWVEGEQLLHVEDLDTALDSLGSDNDVVPQDSDLSPPRSDGVILRQTTEVDQFTLTADLGESSAVKLSNGHKLSAVLRGPTP